MPYINQTPGNWILHTIGIKRDSGGPPGPDRWVDYKENTSVYFDQSKNYQFVTGVSASTILADFKIKLSSPFSTSTMPIITGVNGTSGSRVMVYANPLSNASSNFIIQYGATNLFNGTDGSILSTRVNEIEFLINGYKKYTDALTGSPIDDKKGWYYDYETEDYIWFSGPSGTSEVFSSFGNGLNATWTTRNYIAKKADYDIFNIKFDYQTNASTNPSDGVAVYISSKLNDTTKWVLVSDYVNETSSSTKSIYGLSGKNEDGSSNYVIISGSNSTSASTFWAKLSNIEIFGGYHEQNNDQFLMTNSGTYSDPTDLEIIGVSDAVYSFLLGYDTIITGRVDSRVGNGLFKAGIWENGVWNSGWRDDTAVRDFDDITSSIKTYADVRWNITISGDLLSVNEFIIGDQVSISNIVAIDINENRKLLKGIFTVVNKGSDYIVVQTDTTFPYIRIERDSPNHKIKVTKNVWLSGAFLTGYFTGVWSYGLFKGFPLMTEMYDTHWIDGIFDGGHFNSEYPTYDFTETFNYNEYLGLSFSTGHGYIKGDWLVIDKDNKSVNPDYDGISQVSLVIDDQQIVLNTDYGVSSLSESGSSTRWTATGLIQNFKFTDNNRSTITSNDSSISTDVFSYYSWLDINYDNTRSVTIGRDLRKFDSMSRKNHNKNNLYGYPTYDILSSESLFRDSNSLTSRSYKLGTKYKIFNDFIGDSSKFSEPFGPETYTDQITLSIDTENDAISSGSFRIYAVPLSNNPFRYLSATSSRYDILNQVKLICTVAEVNNYLTMTANISNSINSLSSVTGYTSSYVDNILTITDLDNDSYERVGLIIRSINYGLKVTSNIRPGNTSIIFPEQDIERRSPIRFGRLKEGVGYQNFEENGWKFDSTRYMDTQITRTEQSDDDPRIEGEELQVTSINSGVVLNNDNISMSKSRYSIVEFDAITWSVSNDYYLVDGTNYDANIPVINLSNLNLDIKSGQYSPLSYLPINSNINHFAVSNSWRLDSVEDVNANRWGGWGENQSTKKYEYFYSKTDLMMNISGNGINGVSQSMVVLDNIKMYEVDMIPFFKYYVDSNIFTGVVSPYQATAPLIDYTSANYKFIDNINIGLDSINPTQ